MVVSRSDTPRENRFPRFRANLQLGVTQCLQTNMRDIRRSCRPPLPPPFPPMGLVMAQRYHSIHTGRLFAYMESLCGQGLGIYPLGGGGEPSRGGRFVR